MKSSKFQHKILVIYYLIIVKIVSSHKNTTKIDSNEKDSHLKYGYVKRVCSNRVQICKSNHTVVCTMRLFGGKAEYKDFENSCFLFLNNMCNDFDREYNILTSGTCEEYFKSRRQNNPTPNDKTKTMATIFPSTKKAARMETYNYSARYEVNTAPDEHLCPLSCPPIYEPVCVNVNTGYGLYFKMYTFVNHCAGDLYYCEHWEEFQPPPGGDEEKVQTSLLSMRACAQNRFIQFARFTEMASAIGHYGWLAGDYRPSYILKPHERKTGYG